VKEKKESFGWEEEEFLAQRETDTERDGREWRRGDVR
jgi:hypothetical protein